MKYGTGRRCRCCSCARGNSWWIGFSEDDNKVSAEGGLDFNNAFHLAPPRGEVVVEALVPSACLFSSVLENKHRYNFCG